MIHNDVKGQGGGDPRGPIFYQVFYQSLFLNSGTHADTAAPPPVAPITKEREKETGEGEVGAGWFSRSSLVTLASLANG